MKTLKTILSWIYKLVIVIRHRLYDWGLFKSFSFDIPIVCIGNITVGGTGKTPAAEYLISQLGTRYQIALLSRGYGRSTKGYREVTTRDDYGDVGDEPLQIKLKYPSVTVVVSEDRVAAVERIRAEHPEVNLIIMDDGFQHRRLRAKVNIIIIDASRPIDADRMLPLGRLRDVKSRLRAAHFFIVTKCPDTMSPLDKRLWCNNLRKVAYQKIYFSRISHLGIEPLFRFEERQRVDYGQQAILVSGIGNARPFLTSAGKLFNEVATFTYGDHHDYTAEDLRDIYECLKRHPRAIILLTEKDAVKLRRAHRLPEMMRRAMYYLPIEMTLVEGPDHNFIPNLIEEIDHVEQTFEAKGK